MITFFLISRKSRFLIECLQLLFLCHKYQSYDTPRGSLILKTRKSPGQFMTDRLSIGILLGIEFRWVVFHFKPEFVSDLDNTRVVTIDPLLDLRIAARQPEVRPFDIPVNAVHRKTDMDTHTAVRVVTAENTRIVIFSLLERNYRRIENRIRRRKRASTDEWIRAVTPQNLVRTRGKILSQHIGQIRTRNFQYVHITCRSVCHHR